MSAGTGGVAFPASTEEAVAWLHKHFDAEMAGDLRALCRFELTGAGGGELVVRIAGGRLEIGPPSEAGEDLRFRLSTGDFFAILGGRANAELLFMEDRVEVEGDLSLALKVRQLFRASG